MIPSPNDDDLLDILLNTPRTEPTSGAGLYGEYKAGISARHRELAERAYTREQKTSPYKKEKLAVSPAFGGQSPEPKPKKKKADYNERTRKTLIRLGYFPVRVDYYDALLGLQHDLMGIFDYLALGDGETVAVQVTSAANMSARKKKIEESPNYAHAVKAGWRVLILGYKKLPNGRFEEVLKWLN